MVIAIYLRLSQKDKKAGADESNSISNQRIIIKNYIHNNNSFKNYNIIEFCDDGYSGTSMDRPGMNKMLGEVKKNRINCIIVKDLSRFSRDYIELGRYMEQIFPFMGVRLVSVNDNYDSSLYNATAGFSTEFKTLLYDLYSKDISAKVKTSLENKFAMGRYAAGQIPFGYNRSSTIKNAIEVNEKEAEIVRYIFSLAVQGKSSVQIAKQLYKEKIPSIAGLRGKKTDSKKGCTWSYSAVSRILKNRFYLGEMAYGKTLSKYVCSKSRILVPEEEWKVIKEHHTPIISKDIFEKAANIQKTEVKKHKNIKNKSTKNPFTGKLFCGGCGYAMSYKKKDKYQKQSYFWCRKHSLLQIPECCTFYNAAALEQLVSTLLNKELIILADADRQKKNMYLLYQFQFKQTQKQIKDYKTGQAKAWAEKDLLYESYASGQMAKEEYKEKANAIEEKISSLSRLIKEKQKELACIEEKSKTSNDINQVIHYFNPGRLSPEIADTFIKKIYVYKNKSVEIEWTFSDGYKNI